MDHDALAGALEGSASNDPFAGLVDDFGVDGNGGGASDGLEQEGGGSDGFAGLVDDFGQNGNGDAEGLADADAFGDDGNYGEWGSYGGDSGGGWDGLTDDFGTDSNGGTSGTGSSTDYGGGSEWAGLNDDFGADGNGGASSDVDGIYTKPPYARVAPGDARSIPPVYTVLGWLPGNKALVLRSTVRPIATEYVATLSMSGLGTTSTAVVAAAPHVVDYVAQMGHEATEALPGSKKLLQQLMDRIRGGNRPSTPGYTPSCAASPWEGQRINIMSDFYQKVTSRHGPGANLSHPKHTRFAEGFDYAAGIRHTLDQPDIVCEQVYGWPGCVYAKVYDAPIGSSGDGNAASLLTVAFDGAGSPIIAFPRSSLPRATHCRALR